MNGKEDIKTKLAQARKIILLNTESVESNFSAVDKIQGPHVLDSEAG